MPIKNDRIRTCHQITVWVNPGIRETTVISISPITRKYIGWRKQHSQIFMISLPYSIPPKYDRPVRIAAMTARHRNVGSRLSRPIQPIAFAMYKMTRQTSVEYIIFPIIISPCLKFFELDESMYRA
jgi:hypothetical protein